MPPRLELPDTLTETPFTPAHAALAGVSRKRLEHRALARPTYGARSDAPIRTVLDQVRGTLVALPPDVVLSHRTAARLWDLPMPTPWSVAEPVDVMRADHRTPLRRRGVTGHRGLESRVIVQHRGVPVVSAADSWCDLAASLGLEDLVVLGDALLEQARGLRADELDHAIARRYPLRGIPVVAIARSLIRERSESPMETRARLLFVRGGLPEPDLNVKLLHSVEGQWLATPDFVWRERRVAAEYDGEHHYSSARQWRLDVGRRENLADDGWRLVVLTAADILLQPDATVGRLRRLLCPRA